ncbi:MAG: protein kinase [Burkholderiales bacterium]|nr:protein kinase [Burkholderiales bacterium]
MAFSIDELRTLDGLLRQAQDLPAPERERWIATLPPQHAAFLPYLREHLRDDGVPGVETADFLRTLPKLGEGGTATPAGQPGAGDRVGPWALVRPLGEGGMGTVWLARRADGAFQREVALKLPHRHLLDRGLAERMARERDILASLNDDRIARLYEAGFDADGRPYLALEFVAGTPIDAWCADPAVGLEARVALMAQVARAVAHAHANLVVHRDLKPGNILVTTGGAAPSVKLLDFGVAKLLAGEGEAGGADLTRVLGQALTPDYASPEQVLDKPLTTATDIYSLGVVLYQVACGEKPYMLRGRGAQAIAQAIVEADIVRPSRRAAAGVRAKEARRMRGDLDAIILKAMKARPEERYATASELADDLERFLARRPVLAQPDSLAYRAGRFLRRNALAAGAGATVAVALVAGTGVAAWQARQARLEAAKTAAVKDFLLSVFTAGSINQEDASLRRKRPIADVLTDAAKALPSRFDDQPEIKDELRQALGQLLYDLGLTAQAREIAEARAQALAASGAPLAQRMRAQVSLAMATGETGDMKRSGELLDAVAGALDGASGREARAVLGEALTQRAMHRVVMTGGRGAVEDARRAAALLRQASPGTEAEASALIMLGLAQGFGGDIAAAQAAFDAALPIARALPGDAAKLEAAIHTRLTEVLMRNDEWARALGHARQALAIIERFAGGDSFSWARTAIYAGLLMGRTGESAEAIRVLEQAERNFARFGADIDPEFAGAARAFLSQTLLDHGQLARAREVAETAYAPFAEVKDVATAPASINRGASRLGYVLQAQGDYARSTALFGRARAAAEAVGGAAAPDVLAMRRLIALNEAWQGRRDAAIAELRRVIEADRSPAGRLATQAQLGRLALARVLLDAGRPDEAGIEIDSVAAAMAALPASTQAFQAPFLAQLEGLRGERALQRGEAGEAVARFGAAVERLAPRHHPQSPVLASARADLARALAASGERSRARALADEARAAFAAAGPAAPHLRRSLAAADRLLGAR